MKRFFIRPLILNLCALGLLTSSAEVLASGFQLFEQDVTSIANYHAGYAALADNASISFYNPAGITQFQNQQLVFSGIAVDTSFKYKGTVAVSNDFGPTPVTAQGGILAFIPAFSYVKPLTDRIGFGFTVNVPFGLKTNYGTDTIVRYVATENSIRVVDVSPALAFKLTDKASVGFGVDIQRMNGEFDQVGTFLSQELDSDGINQVSDTAYGFHVGALYNYSPDIRAGISYHSQVVHHLTGTSSFTGPLADFFDATIEDSNAKLNMTLPAYTAFSLYDRLHPQFAMMGSIIYTQWSSIQNFVLQNVAGVAIIDGLTQPSTNIIVTIPQHFRNTWNFSLGGDYYATDKLTVRGAVGYDQAPANNTYRTLQLPDNNRYVIALGGHYQMTKTLGADLGWTHLFINKAHVNPPTQVAGAIETSTNGSVTGGADVYGAQLVWDIA